MTYTIIPLDYPYGELYAVVGNGPDAVATLPLIAAMEMRDRLNAQESEAKHE